MKLASPTGDFVPEGRWGNMIQLSDAIQMVIAVLILVSVIVSITNLRK